MTIDNEMTPKLIKIACGLLLFAVNFTASADKSWQTIRSEKVSEAKVVASSDEIEVRTQNGAIIVSTGRPTQIKVFTILGQLVSQENLPTGVSSLKLGTHGVFIVKVGGLTCKVAL